MRRNNGFLYLALRIVGLIAIFYCNFSAVSYSQSQIDTFFNKINPDKFIQFVSNRTEKLERKLLEKSLKVLERMEREEKKIYSKMLNGKDSLLAKEKLNEINEKYFVLNRDLKSSKVSAINNYIPKLDSLTTTLKFMDQNSVGSKIKEAIAKSSSLQNKFQQAEEIKRFIKERKFQLKEELEKLGLVKQLKQINKQLYYYSAQIKEYKEILKDSKRIERKTLVIISKSKWFQEFFKKSSLLAKLFRMPGDPNDPVYLTSLSGLQSRAQVNALVQQQIQAGGPNAGQVFHQNLQSAQAQLKQLKNKIRNFGGRSSDDISPDGFKPNSQKTKTLLQRIEISTNIQSQKGTGYFPNSSDLGLNVGYKLNDKSIIGIGASYKLGLGRGWNAIKFTSEGAGLRTFIDWKIKGNFWISGGFEMNYKSGFNRFDQLKDFNAWQQSGLIGISKSIPIKTKYFKKSKLQLLWDFLSSRQRPKTQSIIFRVGYNIK